MIRRGRLVGVMATVLALGGAAAIPAFAGAQRGVGERFPAGGAARAESLQVFYTPPVLVRAGERVTVPVDAACITTTGDVCSATVTLSALGGSAGWTRASAASSAFLRFDLSAPAARAAAAGSGSVAFTIAARSAAGTSTALGSASAPLRFYVVRSMPTVRVPAASFGAMARGHAVVYLPWGTGPGRAGIALGNESPTLGPPSFDIGPDGSVYLLDGLQRRLAVFGRRGLARSVPLERTSPDADVAVAPTGASFVLSSDGGAVDRAVRVSAIGARARAAGTPAVVSRGIPERLDVAGGRPFARTLPLDEWREASAAAAAGGPSTVGRPLPDGSQLLSVVRGRAVRLAIVRAGRVEHAVELAFATDLGELALAETDGHGGYVAVVHVARDVPTPADAYQVVHLIGARIVRTFTVARRNFAATAALSRFRLGSGGWLYQLTSSPDGVRVLRYRIGGAA